MLHEILLSLSGRPSSLFPLSPPSAGRDARTGEKRAAPSPSTADANPSSIFPQLSPAEAALLKNVATLSRLHRDVRSHSTAVSRTHASLVARAVASTVLSGALVRLQKEIVRVEEGILRRDAAVVGAYDIVPLAGVVGEFEAWLRPLEWLWGMVGFLGGREVHGAKVIDRLRREAQTGYPEIERLALELSRAAETSWVRQMAGWVLYGRLPDGAGADRGKDLFVKEVGTAKETDLPVYEIDAGLVPVFVGEETANSILFVGRALHHVRKRRTEDTMSQSQQFTAEAEMELLSKHLTYLSQLSVPLSAAALSSAISSIRASLSRNVLQKLLPVEDVIRLMDLLRDFFLLGRGEFAVSLVKEADERLYARSKHLLSQRQSSDAPGLRNMLIRDAETHSILTKSFSSLASHSFHPATADDDGDTDIDDALDLAQDLLSLGTSKPSLPHRKSLLKTSFSDFLLPVPTYLTMHLSPPYDLFLTPRDTETYTLLHSYLLSIRRAHLHLSTLWTESALRRDYPVPLGPPRSCTPGGKMVMVRARERRKERRRRMRRIWAACAEALFFLSELGEYFEGEVVRGSWDVLREWIVRGVPQNGDENDGSNPLPHSQPSGQPKSSSTPTNLSTSLQALTLSTTSPSNPTRTVSPSSSSHPHDPSALSTAHTLFLHHLTHALLLTSPLFPPHLRTLLRLTDALVAHIGRLQRAHRALDLQDEDGVEDVLVDHAAEERAAWQAVEQAAGEVGRCLETLRGVLRQVGEGRHWDGEGDEETDAIGGVDADVEAEKGAFRPWTGAGVERVLMRLEFARGGGEEEGAGGEEW